MDKSVQAAAGLPSRPLNRSSTAASQPFEEGFNPPLPTLACSSIFLAPSRFCSWLVGNKSRVLAR